MRWLAGRGLTCWAVTVAVAVTAGCSAGDAAPEGRASRPAKQTSLQASGAWLLALVVENPQEDDQRVYASFHPKSGELVLQRDGRRPSADSDVGGLNKEHELLVSADARWYRDQVLADEGERDSGVIALHGLLSGSRSVDLRELTGEIRLEPSQVVFDGADPNMLWFFSTDGDVYKVDLNKDTATKTGTTPADVHDDETELVFAQAGGGKIVEVPVTLDVNGKVATAGVPDDGSPARLRGEAVDERDYPDLPDGDHSLFKTKDGTVWALGIEGDEDQALIRAYRIRGGGDDWERLPGQARWASAGALEDIDWIRPPLR